MVSVKVGDLLRNHPHYKGLDATVAAVCGNVMFLTTRMGGNLRPELIDPWPAAYLPPARPESGGDKVSSLPVFTWNAENGIWYCLRSDGQFYVLAGLDWVAASPDDYRECCRWAGQMLVAMMAGRP